jgi:hypothetical protein
MSSITELYLKVTGPRMDSDRERVFKSGKMAASISATGNKIKPMAKVDLYTLMVMSTRVNGTTTKLKEEELTNTWMGPNTSVTGKRTDNMAMEWKHGQIKPSMRATTSMVKNMVLVVSSGLTPHLILENSTIITFMAKVSIHGPIIGVLKENGARIKCMVKEHLHGLMVENMLVSTLMTKRKATANSCGLMVGATGVSG